jgi:hypothetical protein
MMSEIETDAVTSDAVGGSVGGRVAPACDRDGALVG